MKMKRFSIRDSILSAFTIVGLFIASSGMTFANADTDLKIIKGTCVTTPQKMTLKTLNEVILLEDSKKVLMTAADYDKNSMVQAFNVCIQGYFGKNDKSRKVIYVQSLCDK